jgi:hypothetical protein
VAVRSFGYVELATHVFLVCRVLRTCSNDLRRRGRQHFGGASRVPSYDSLGESTRSGLHWLYLTMALLKTLLWNLCLSSG